MKKYLVAFAATLGLAGTALAQEVTVTDTDADGSYSLEELQIVYPELTQEVFDVIDANGDGGIDEDELAAAQAAGVLR
jgi:hypothetical protein